MNRSLTECLSFTMSNIDLRESEIEKDDMNVRLSIDEEHKYDAYTNGNFTQMYIFAQDAYAYPIKHTLVSDPRIRGKQKNICVAS